MLKRLLAITFIFVCTSFAWMFLGGTIVSRTNSAGTNLRGRVESIWGVPQTQVTPTALYDSVIPTQESVTENGSKKVIQRSETVSHKILPDASDVTVALGLEHRQKGLLWYSTYKVAFQGDYAFHNPDGKPHQIRFSLPFPAASALYDGLQFSIDGRRVTPLVVNDAAWVTSDLAPGQTAKLHVGYRSQGLDSWAYSFGEKVNPVQNFHLRMSTNFRDVDFPGDSLAPTAKSRTPGGWQLDWNYENLLSGYQISLTMPEKLQPGPLASEISFFAPVSLFFFFFVMFILTTTRNLELHPMNYFFLGAAFFAFHLLLAYMVDHVDIYWAFAISSLVSVILVVTYLRLVVGAKFASREAALAQFTFLVLFSFAFFFKGFTGLAITIGAILTLFVTMQITGRIRWREQFAPAPPPLPFNPGV